ncbi:hypothetical protein [Hyphomicrobium sp. CS1GBMeth3]|uniref:hypothetical protein n=1 Tax=Hyphomicrobium sp. CS1GBMeth3 TaxID=1892845 RepID=UPI000930D804|nr:hypothetical protein [Hyphomicrobium sp. CS1GBMeth3]
MPQDEQLPPSDKARAKSTSLGWPDYVLRGAVVVSLAMLLMHLFGSDDEREAAVPWAVAEHEPAENGLPVLAAHAEAVWARVALVLGRLGHLDGSDTSALPHIRTALKRYQHTVGVRETGTLDQELLNRLFDEPIDLDPYIVRGAAVHGRWFLVMGPERCEISAGASRIDGRVLVTERPVLRFGRERQVMRDDEIDIDLGTKGQFEAATPVVVSAGDKRLPLRAGGGKIAMALEPRSAWLREIVRALSAHEGEVQMSGASALGGPLTLSFPTAGFEAAYRAMASTCGAGALAWIEG